MLVMSRKKNETLVIGDKIEVTIIDVKGEKVRIGVKAPVDVAVHRKEVYNVIQKGLGEAKRREFVDPPNLEEIEK